MDTPVTDLVFGPWNPGVNSTLPHEFLGLATLFRPENAVTNLAHLRELSDFSGIALQDLVEFRPERLAVHELLIRITADLSVPDGTKYEDLGINFRLMASTILSKYVLPKIDDIKRLHDTLRQEVARLIEQELGSCFAQPLAASPTSAGREGLLKRFRFASKPQSDPKPLESVEERDQRIMTAWNRKAVAAATELERRTYQSLAVMASSVAKRRGRLVGDPKIWSALVIPAVCNDYGSELIGSHIEPYFQQAVAEEGYRLLPFQTNPVVMNVKGASASGKSTMRPLQKQLAARLGVRWDEFALISPDIWRKFLLDYDSLGPARRYAGTLTGQEVAIIDRKLDQYMANKGDQGRMSHLLIDRFRFDSFAADPDKERGSRLLTRFGRLIYMFFMITPPEATVERAWTRGEQFGRYKAVDDLLHHNVEAYTGMPQLFFTWTGKKDKRVHFEFLDNSVPEGHRPRTVAFGTNGEMNILDIKMLLDIDRFKKINLDAGGPEEVYPAGSLTPEKNVEFLKQCARRIPIINFADHESGRIYATVRDGKMVCGEEGSLDPDAKAGIAAVAGELRCGMAASSQILGTLSPGSAHTLGAWGSEADA